MKDFGIDLEYLAVDLYKGWLDGWMDLHDSGVRNSWHLVRATMGAMVGGGRWLESGRRRNLGVLTGAADQDLYRPPHSHTLD